MVNPLDWFRRTPTPPPAAPVADAPPAAPVADAPPEHPVVTIDQLAAALVSPTFSAGADYTGEKFPGGFGATSIFTSDYWTLRERSAQLFTENLYARGLIRRLVTNVINTGLSLEATPDESVIGVAEDSLSDWAEDVENRFHIYSSNPVLCDYRSEDTLGQIEANVYREALVDGDVLVILRQSKEYGTPQVEIVKGSRVRTPLDERAKGKIIKHGVEVDKKGRHVAYWIEQDDNDGGDTPSMGTTGRSVRVPAWGKNSGRRVSWLVYGTDRRYGTVRGQPILALVLQSLKEIDRYRDSAQRKAVINSILAMFIKKTDDKAGTMPVSGGAVRKGTTTVTDTDGGTRSFKMAESIPGVVYEELQTGEEPVPFSTAGTDLSFGDFENTIIRAIAWACEVPPEILILAFTNNFSASQAAINEAKMFLARERFGFAMDLPQRVYIEWLLLQVLVGKIPGGGMLEAWRDPASYDIFGAWISATWIGAVKPSTDINKQAQGTQKLVREGWFTNARATRDFGGGKWSKNIKRVHRENELKAAALRPLLEVKAEFGIESTEEALDELNARVVDGVADAMATALEEGVQ